MFNSPEEFFKIWGFWPMAGGALEDEEAGGGGGESEHEEAPPADETEDKKIEVSEKEYKSLTELREKTGQDFDADKWGKLKTFDPQKVAENMEFGTAVEKDAMVQAILKERIAAGREKRKMNMANILEQFKDELETAGDKDPKKNGAGKEKEVDPAVKYLLEKDQKDAEEKIIKEFGETFEKEVTAQKLKLTTREKNFLNKLVQEAYIADQKLGFDSMSKIVKEQVKEILEYRKELHTDWNKKISGEGEEEEEAAPTPVRGAPSIPQKRAYDPKKATSSQRTEAIAAEMKNMGYGN